MKVVYLQPSTFNDVDTEVIQVENETWAEVLDKLESLLDAHFLDYGWNGKMSISIEFKNMSKKEFADLVEIFP